MRRFRVAVDIKAGAPGYAEARREAQLIEAALARHDVRAFCMIVGALDPLSERARGRVIRYVVDRLREGEGAL